MNVSFIIPSYNNLRHLKNVYSSIQRHAPQAEIILLDDGSTDNTWEWVKKQDCLKYKSENRVGHTVLYDIGIEISTKDIVGILHADMVIGPNYIENLLKHLSPGKVVCATRIEPPLHPQGKEKIIKDFGMDFDSLDISSFEKYCIEIQEKYKDQTTRGIFAPWILYKKDFQAIGGHDQTFAPYGYEDSDIFNRWILAGYKMIQSRDSLVYHLTCRGHRWNKGVGIENDDYRKTMNRCQRDYIRKWGCWVKNDEYQHPIIPPKYDVGFIIENYTPQLLEILEPWCSRLYVDCSKDYWSEYVAKESHNTSYDLSKKFQHIEVVDKDSDILIEIDGQTFTQQDFQIIQQLSEIIKDSGEVGEFTLGNLKISITQMNELQNDLIKISTQYNTPIEI